MVNPGDLVQAMVDKLQDIPELIIELGGDVTRIFPYLDRYAKHPSIMDAIYQVPSPGIMVCWLGSRPAQERSGYVRREHDFAAYIRVKESADDASASDVYNILVLLETGIPASGDGLPIIETEIDERCDPIGNPMNQARIVTPPPQSLDYFEARFSLWEKGPGEP